MLRGLFVTGTDTNVGKTVVAAALMLRYRELGTLRYWKPIQTGIEHDDDTATVQLLGCLADEVFAPGIRLQRPLAPYLAAELSGVRITTSDLRAYPGGDAVRTRWVAEGAGGVLVPINESEFMTDLMVELGMPVLVVARSSLGTINHTLMTLEVLRRHKLNVAAVVMVGEPNPSNCEAIQRFGDTEVVAQMPMFPKLSAEALAGWATMEFDPHGQLKRYFE
jgi:dethiobiotin synthase